MSDFTGSGAVYPFRAADTGYWTWVVGEPLIWRVDGIGQGFTVTVPQGFLTDLGTMPWWGRILFNPADAQCVKAYVLHDWLLAEFGPSRQMFAASQLYEALRALGVAEWSRKVQTAAVIIGIDAW